MTNKQLMKLGTAFAEGLYEGLANDSTEVNRENDDLIRRQDAIDACLNGFCACVNDCVDEIEKLPSAEPVTYCKDCFFADLCKWRREGAEYCSYAEREK